MRRILSDLARRFRERPIPHLLGLAALVSTVIGLGVAMSLLGRQQREHAPAPRLADALQALQSGQRERARRLAAELRLREDLPEFQQGGPAYVLGAVMMQDAAEHWSPMERRSLYLLASRYLEEALEAGLPKMRKGHAQLLLGKARHESGRFADSVSLLLAALENYPAESTEIHRLLADAYLRSSNPRLEKALEHNREYLSDPALDAAQREQAWLTQAQILMQQDDMSGCRSTLEQIAEDSRRYPDALLVKGQLLMREAERAASGPPNGEPEDPELAETKYSAARDAFIRARQRASDNREIVRRSRYLLGIAYRKQGDLQRALREFSRVRSTHFDTAEGLAAGLEEAELQRRLDQHPEAIESYRRVLKQAADVPGSRNRWLPLEQLLSRVEEAYDDYYDAEQFAWAVKLAEVLSPTFPAEQATQLQADAQWALAEHLHQRAESLTPAEADPVREQARKAWRRAARYHEKLAELRFSTRRYPEQLWNSAEAYVRGHNFRRAEQLLETLLTQQARRNRPRALAMLGRARLELGRPRAALEALLECIDFFPKDPRSYRARVLAAEAHRELGNFDAARNLLIGNLEHESLTPRSIEWRDSLYALGKLHYRQGLRHETQGRVQNNDTEQEGEQRTRASQLKQARDHFQEAVARLSEAVQRDRLAERDPLLPETIEARYLIAESHRQSAKLPMQRLETAVVAATQDKLNQQLEDDLTAAEAGYRELQQLLDEKKERGALSGLQERILRNCYFARADALYDLNRYDAATDAYASAVSRFQYEPESLEAYVQIANCHRQLNQPSQARRALEQAQIVLQQIAEDADFSSTTRYRREEWSEVLDWLSSS